MSTDIEFRINGQPARAPAGISVAAAIMTQGTLFFRESVSGKPRAPLCGMGICFECRVTLNGRPQQKSCQIQVEAGMEIQTDE
jgi:sarcosine oxidase subunit alpha